MHHRLHLQRRDHFNHQHHHHHYYNHHYHHHHHHHHRHHHHHHHHHHHQKLFSGRMRTRSARSRRIIVCASSRQDHVMCGKTHNCRVANATALFAQTRETLLQAQDRLGPVPGRRSTCLRSIEAGSWGSPRRALSLRSLPVSPHEPKTLLRTWGGSGLTSPSSRRLAVSASSRSTSRVVAIAPSTSWCGTVPMRAAIQRRAFASA